MDNQEKGIRKIQLTSEMKTSFMNYAMSVIVARALPDVRDGMKPVQRRIVYGMNELGCYSDKAYKKSARIVGEVMGKYHPHGDSSIYEALVRMAQDFSYRYMLVDGHGNFGSIDGDGAAAMRYTEARMSKISMELMRDINKDTIDFIPNYDGEEREPSVLPCRIPNLLVNGTTGIAVGMATNMPPHNIGEVIDAVIAVSKNPDISVMELMENYIQGPDFPTGGYILGKSAIKKAYETGNGLIVMRAKTEIEEHKGRQRIVAYEIPYQVNKARLVEKIAHLARDKVVEGISDVRDESNREGIRIVIELKRDVQAEVVLNQLYKLTSLQTTFGVNNIALVNNEPKTLTLKELIQYYLSHQEEVIRRRTQFELNKAEARAHILEGLLKALDHIDEVIKIIRGSANVAEAKRELMERFELTDPQAQAIVDMRLRALTGLEREKLENEYKELEAKIAELRAILADENKLLGVIKKEILVISEKYGDDRRTKIGFDDDMSVEDLISDDDTVIAMTNLGYIKRMSVDNFKSQNRGGKGIKGMQTIDEDFIEDLLMTTNHHYIMFFTNMGRCYRIKAYEIPEAGRTARGTAIVNLLQLQSGEKVTAAIPMREIDDDKYLFMATKNGMVKKTPMREYSNMRKTGLQAILLREGDELIKVKVTDNTEDIFLATKFGMSIRFKETDARITGRVSYGVIGMKLDEGDEVVGMQMASQGEYMLVVSEKGYGKRTGISEFKLQLRGGKGLLCYNVTEKTGNLVGMKLLDDGRDIMLITNEGILIRMGVDDISVIGRNTSGVKLMSIDADSNVRVASIAKVRESSRQDEEDENVEDPESEENEDGEITE